MASQSDTRQEVASQTCTENIETLHCVELWAGYIKIWLEDIGQEQKLFTLYIQLL